MSTHEHPRELRRQTSRRALIFGIAGIIVGACLGSAESLAQTAPPNNHGNYDNNDNHDSDICDRDPSKCETDNSCCHQHPLPPNGIVDGIRHRTGGFHCHTRQQHLESIHCSKRKRH